jgi:DNA-binding NarL/FixJ family response regulator
LRRSHPLVPVVMISADEDPPLAAQALREGASGWLPKTADAAGLAGALELVLQGGCAVPAFLARWARDESAAPGEPAERLTERQSAVLDCLAGGLSNKEIARVLAVSEATVKAHLVSIFRALNVRNRAQAALVARDRLQARPKQPSGSGRVR